jgi:tRNA nucleotidyltransferase/poly(A) polymerase
MTPIKKIAIPEWMSDPDAASVFAALQDEQDPRPAVLFVGGCVRDALMRRAVGDLDMATIHPPDIVMARLQAAGIDFLEIGIEHGTVVARFGAKQFQITTLRVDVETDGRHATVAYTDDWTEDASRRDFTFNALYADREGRIFDPLDGLSDLQARQVRFIGEPSDRIAEDALRILRFFRFYAQIEGAKLDPDRLEACSIHAGGYRELVGRKDS